MAWGGFLDDAFRFARAIRRTLLSLMCMCWELFAAVGTQQVAYKFSEPSLRRKLPLNSVTLMLLRHGPVASGVNRNGLHHESLLRGVPLAQTYEHGR